MVSPPSGPPAAAESPDPIALAIAFAIAISMIVFVTYVMYQEDRRLDYAEEQLEAGAVAEAERPLFAAPDVDELFADRRKRERGLQAEEALGVLGLGSGQLGLAVGEADLGPGLHEGDGGLVRIGVRQELGCSLHADKLVRSTMRLMMFGLPFGTRSSAGSIQ